MHGAIRTAFTEFLIPAAGFGHGRLQRLSNVDCHERIPAGRNLFGEIHKVRSFARRCEAGQ